MDIIKKNFRRKMAFLLALIFILSPIISMADSLDMASKTVTISVEKFILGQRYILEPEKVSFKEGDNYAKLIANYLTDNFINYDNDGTISESFYLKRIYHEPDSKVNLPEYLKDINIDIQDKVQDGIGQGDYTTESGWMLTVNDKFADKGLSSLYPKTGDVIRLQFSIYGYGKDIGSDFGGESFDLPNRDELTELLADVNSDKGLLDKKEVREAKEEAIEVISNLDSTNGDIKEALENLKEAIEDKIGTKKEIDQWVEEKIEEIQNDVESKENPGEWYTALLGKVDGKISKTSIDKVLENLFTDEEFKETVSAGDLAKSILALRAGGYDPQNIYEVNLVSKLIDKLDGNNIYTDAPGLWAINSDYNYKFTENEVKKIDKIVRGIISTQKSSGLFHKTYDDTGFALLALAPYYNKSVKYNSKYLNNEELVESVNKALEALSDSQFDDGDIVKDNSNSLQMIIVGITSINSDKVWQDEFIKEGRSLLHALKEKYDVEGGFKWKTSDNKLNPMATEQGFRALISYVIDSCEHVFDYTSKIKSPIIGREKDPEIDDEQEKDPEIDDEQEKDPEIDDEQEKDPEIDDEKEKDPEIDDEKEKDPEIDDEKEKDPEIDDGKEKDPEIDDEQEKDPEIDDEQEKDPEIDDEKEKDPEIDDGKEKDPEIDDEKIFNIRIEANDKTILESKDVKVSKLDLSEYGIDQKFEDVRPIHVIIEALEKYTDIDPKDSNDFNHNGGTYISKIGRYASGSVNPGEKWDNDGWMYTVNNVSVDEGIDSQDIEEKDKIVLYFVEDFNTNKYAYFNKEEVEINLGEELELELTGSNWQGSEKISDADILIDGEKSNYKTDENGRVKIKFDKSGDYHITAERYEGEFRDISRPYARVKVVNNEEIRKELKDKIEEAEAKSTDGKTTSSKLNLERAIEDAKNTLAKDNSSKDELEEALRKLRKAIDNLVDVSNSPGGSSSSRDRRKNRDKKDKEYEDDDYEDDYYYDRYRPYAPSRRYTSTSDEPKDFKDLQGYAWAEKAIKDLSLRNIIKGKTDDRFDPAANIKRADFAVIVARYLRLDTKNVILLNNFDDISRDDYYYSSVNLLANKGIINGKGERRFDPNAPITREEIAKILAALDNSSVGSKDKIESFKDKGKIAPWSKDSLAKLVNKGIITGYDDGTIRPKGKAKRAEVAVMIHRLVTK